MFRSSLALALFFACAVANGTGYVRKSNGAGGDIVLSDRPIPTEVVKLIPECKGGFEAKNTMPDRMNIYGCWWPNEQRMVTVKWFDPYDGVVTYTYNAKDFRK